MTDSLEVVNQQVDVVGIHASEKEAQDSQLRERRGKTTSSSKVIPEKRNEVQVPVGIFLTESIVDAQRAFRSAVEISLEV